MSLKIKAGLVMVLGALIAGSTLTLFAMEQPAADAGKCACGMDMKKIE